jgi:L-histidine Nalpha-methyltransferase
MTNDSSVNIKEITAGLMQEQAFLEPKYFYDEMGSKLFEAITLLKEYYPTRIEQTIFAQHLTAIADSIGVCDVLIDLGAGNCQKASQLFNHIRPKEYLALDISKEFLEAAILDLQKIYPDIQMRAQVFDLKNNLAFPELLNRKKVFFYPGSSIGNFTPDQAQDLMKNIVQVCDGSGGLLIGVDLVKDRRTLEQAYDDALGVTAAFNLNALLHINHLIGSDFSVDQWQHQALFNTEQSRIEMHLVSTCTQTVSWPGGSRTFSAGQTIHTENSYKYKLADFSNLLRQAGFKTIHTFTDPDTYFLVCYASVASG